MQRSHVSTRNNNYDLHSITVLQLKFDERVTLITSQSIE
jgi:hypothetical protein